MFGFRTPVDQHKYLPQTWHRKTKKNRCTFGWWLSPQNTRKLRATFVTRPKTTTTAQPTTEQPCLTISIHIVKYYARIILFGDVCSWRTLCVIHAQFLVLWLRNYCIFSFVFRLQEFDVYFMHCDCDWGSQNEKRRRRISMRRKHVSTRLCIHQAQRLQLFVAPPPIWARPLSDQQLVVGSWCVYKEWMFYGFCTTTCDWLRVTRSRFACSHVCERITI